MTPLRVLTVCLALVLTACGARAPDGPPPGAAGAFEGAWHGRLSIAGQALRLEIVLQTGADGVEGRLISLDQGGAAVALTSLTIDGDEIAFAANPPGLSYEGVREGDVIKGTFRQSIVGADLTLERGRFNNDAASGEAKPTRLGENETAVTIETGEVTLAGTLHRPQTARAGLVILSGSGSQDRDGTFGAIEIYAALADALAEQGVASLRLDDRGVGESTGPAPDAPADLAADAAAALQALADQAGVSCTGFAGHSEGGLIALLAAPEADPDFIVSLAGMHMSMEETLLGQAEALMRASGAGEAQIAANQRIQEAAFTVLRQAEPGEDVTEDMQAALMNAGAAEAVAAQQARAFGQPYAVASFQLDPAQAAAGYDGPVLGVFGEYDMQVLAGPQSGALTGARSGLPTEIVVLEGVNHLFQQTETGAASEYGSADHPLSEAALTVIAERTAALADQACGG